MSDELRIAIAAVKKGAKIALKYYGTVEKGGITLKEDNSPVTKADLEVEDVIKQTILNSFPDSEFISEESDDTTENFKKVWIIDPIDGTREYSNGINLWSILIAYALEGEVLLGVAYYPALGIMVYAEKGKGAFINDDKTVVSKTDDLHKAFLGYSPIRFFNEKEIKILLSCISSTGPSRCYSTSFSNYCLATGKMDLYISSRYNKIWDIAPFVRIIKEAGGIITDWEGNELDIHKSSAAVVASNGLLHKQIYSIIKQYKQ